MNESRGNIYLGVNTATRVHAELLKIFLTTDMHRSQLSPLGANHQKIE